MAIATNNTKINFIVKVTRKDSELLEFGWIIDICCFELEAFLINEIGNNKVER